MQADTAFWHLGNFVLPALVTAGATVLASRWRLRHRPHRQALWKRWLVVSGAALVAACAVVVLTGQDGTMGGYAAMLAACVLATAWLERSGAG